MLRKTIAAMFLVWVFGLPACSASYGPDIKPASERPVQVYILSGQSNMVGMGTISGGTRRWGKEFLEPVLSVYPGAYDAKADYDAMESVLTRKLESFGGVRPAPYPMPSGGGTAVVRGHIRMAQAGIYEFRPGYGDSTHNIMEIEGRVVHRKEPGKPAVCGEFTFAAGRKYAFRIIYLTRAANGLGWHLRTDFPGTVKTLVKQGKFRHLGDVNGNWKARKDVIYKGVISAVGQGPLRVGIQAGNTIGPEMQFGHVMGDFHEEPVLLIKASIGNRGLGWDILPPGSERFTFGGKVWAGYKDSPKCWDEGTKPEPIGWYAGKTYDRYVEEIHKVLNNFDTLFPAFKGRGYEVAGFVWWQGHKDGNDAHASRYEQNLVNLIKAWRKEFKAPKAPWVTATIGFGGWEMKGPHAKVAEAQLAVSGESGKYPEFKGNVLTVESRDFWRSVEQSPRNQDYHYNRNAETYLLVGDALGKGMVKLKTGK